MARSTKNKKNNFLIPALLGIVLVLGVLIVKKYEPLFRKSDSGSNVTQKSNQTVSPAQQQARNEVVPDFLDKLSQDEKMVLRLPLPTAPDEARRAHYELALRLAKDAEFLELGDCKPTAPLVMNLVQGQKLVANNSSSKDH